MAPALRDWETGNPLAHESDSFADNGREGAASTLLGKKRHSSREAFVLERIRRRGAKQATPKVMSSLMAFAEECRTRSAKAQSDPVGATGTEPVQAEAEIQNHDTTSAAKTEPLLDDTSFRNLLEE